MTQRLEQLRGLAGLVTLAGLAARQDSVAIPGLVVILALTFLMARIRP